MQKQMTNQEAIETLEIFRDDYTREDSAICQAINIAIDVLKHPTIELEQRHGRWKCICEYEEFNEEMADYLCEICGHVISRLKNQKPEFCEECGTRMDLIDTDVYEKE